MKKRLLSFLLLAVTLFSAFVLSACGKEDSLEGAEVKQAKTITLYSIKQDGTTDEAIAAVEAALNRLIVKTTPTKVKLMLYTAAEYDQAVASKLSAIEEAKKTATKTPGKPLVTQKNTKPLETIVVDGFEEIVFPEVKENQLDIFLIRDQATYMSYADQGYLSQLDSMLRSDYATIRKYIAPKLLNSVKLSGKTYAVPNNHSLGGYTYLLLDKEKIDAQGLTEQYTEINSLYALRDYLSAAKLADPACIPLFNCAAPQFAELEDGLHLGSKFTSELSLDNTVPKLLLNDTEYVEYLAAKKAYEEAGYLAYGDFDGTQNVAATFVTGMPDAIEERYSDAYYLLPFSDPQVALSDIFSSMYAISSSTEDAKRAMEILALIAQDADFCNLLRYGVKDVTYTRADDTRPVHPLGNYGIPSLYAGNQFLHEIADNMTPTQRAFAEKMTYKEVVDMIGSACKDPEWVGEREYALAKVLNNSADVSPYFDFHPTYSKDMLVSMNDVRQLMRDLWVDAEGDPLSWTAYQADQADATVCDYVQALSEFLQNKGSTLALNGSVRAVLMVSDDKSAAGQYRKWYTAQNPAPAQTADPEQTPAGGEPAPETPQ